ncbi:MAG: substrate-binding domain-containing protein [Planctomycetota bacterium]
MPRIATRNDVPVYLQLAESIRRDILRRKLRPGDPYAAYATLSKRFRVAIGTVQRAMNLLVSTGALGGRPGRGTSILSLQPLANSLRARAGSASGRTKTRTRLVGLVTTDIASDHFYAEVIRGAQDALGASGYDPVIANSDDDVRKEERAVERLIRKRVDGFLIDPVIGNLRRGYAHTRGLLRTGLPVVFLDKFYIDLAADCVVSDNVQGAYRLTREMLRRGHRRLAFITEPSCSSVAERRDGFRTAARDAGLPSGSLRVLGGTLLYEEAGYRHGRELLRLARPRRPTAIFGCNDRVARGLYRACSELGLSIPRDVSVVGYDGLPFCATLSPPLSTVVQPRYEMGFEAGRLLLQRLAGSAPPGAQKIIVKGKLILRRSLAKCATHPVRRSALASSPKAH